MDRAGYYPRTVARDGANCGGLGRHAAAAGTRGRRQVSRLQSVWMRQRSRCRVARRRAPLVCPPPASGRRSTCGRYCGYARWCAELCEHRGRRWWRRGRHSRRLVKLFGARGLDRLVLQIGRLLFDGRESGRRGAGLEAGRRLGVFTGSSSGRGHGRHRAGRRWERRHGRAARDGLALDVGRGARACEGRQLGEERGQ